MEIIIEGDRYEGPPTMSHTETKKTMVPWGPPVVIKPEIPNLEGVFTGSLPINQGIKTEQYYPQLKSVGRTRGHVISCKAIVEEDRLRLKWTTRLSNKTADDISIFQSYLERNRLLAIINQSGVEIVVNIFVRPTFSPYGPKPDPFK